MPLPAPGLFAAIPLAACLILGIALFDALPSHPAIYAALAGLAGAASLVQHRLIPRCRGGLFLAGLLPVGFIFLGLSVAQLAWYYPATDDIVHYTAAEPRLARVRLCLDDVPRSTPALHNRPAGQSVRCRVLAVAARDGWRSASGYLHLRLAEVPRLLQIADCLEAVGELARIDPPGNPGEYDFQQYQRNRGVYCALVCEGADAIRVTASAGPGLLDRARQAVRAALARGFDGEARVDLALTQALLLGDSDRSLDEVREDFRRTGTTHALTISGMHIAVLTGFVFLLCRLLRIRPAGCVWIAIAFAIVYGLLTVSSPPVVRSVLMCVGVGAGLIARRRAQAIHLLAVSLIIILLIQPMDLFDAGFQLSFACVAGLMLLASPLATFFHNLENRHVRIARRIRPPTGLAAWALQARTMLINGLAAGLVAWTVSMPLIAWHFRQINPWAVPASMLLAPVVSLTLICGLLKVVLTLLIPASAGWVAIPTHASAAVMRWLVGWMADWPGSDAAMPPVPLWAMAGYFALLVVPLIPRWRERRIVWLGPAAAATLGVCIPLMATLGSHHLSSDVRLTCLSVGAGSCSVVELPGQHTVMVDCGAGGPGIFRRVVDPFLRYRGITRIDTLYLTHGDSDHINGAVELIGSGRVRSLAVHAGQSGIDAVLTVAREAGVPVRVLHRGDVEPYGDARVQVLWPAGDEMPKGNDASLVLRLSTGEHSVLFTGDIGQRPRRELASEKVASEVLIAPHHGSATPDTGLLLEAVRPALIVSSDGRHVSSTQTAFASLAGATPMYHTRECGAVTVELSPGRRPGVSGWVSRGR